jgi:peptidoglycan LD-endopeptidase CwlK
MSAPLFSDDILHSQRLYACAGFYHGELDGEWGPKTDAAAAAWDAEVLGRQARAGRLDGRSESSLATVLPLAQDRLRGLLAVLREGGLDARAISGTRTYAEQDALYRIGRIGGASGRGTVTNARAGQSNHNFGIAIDVGLFDAQGRYLADSPLYDKAGKLAAKYPGIEWGGAWISFRDRPHFQVATGLTLAQVRAAFEAGRPFLEAAPAHRSAT